MLLRVSVVVSLYIELIYVSFRAYAAEFNKNPRIWRAMTSWGEWIAGGWVVQRGGIQTSFSPFTLPKLARIPPST